MLLFCFFLCVAKKKTRTEKKNVAHESEHPPFRLCPTPRPDGQLMHLHANAAPSAAAETKSVNGAQPSRRVSAPWH